MIKISVPNDDSAALFHLGKSLVDLSSTVEGSPGWVVITQEEYDSLKGEQQTEKDVEWLEQKMKDALLETLTNPKNEKIPHNDKVPEMFRQSASRAIEEVLENSPIFARDVEPDTTSQQVESLATMQNFDETATFAEIAEAAPTTDSTDIPWDERIHSASKALNSDGTWRLRRKPADKTPEEWTAYVKWVEEDIHTVLHGQSDDDVLQPPLYEVSPGHIGVMEPNDNQRVIDEAVAKLDALYESEPPVTPVGDDFHVDAGEVTEQQIASIPAPPLPVPPAPPVQQSDMTFPQVMAYLTERHGRITSTQVDDIIAEMGLKSIMDLNTQPEHTGPFIARVKALLGE